MKRLFHRFGNKNPTTRFLALVGFVVVLAVLALVLGSGVRSRAPVSDGSSGKSEAVARGPRRHVDGLVMSDAHATNTPIIAVMIDDAPDGQPASGVGAASVVFEVPVEGPLTRLMALYPSDATVPKIGPVRSARPYFADWVKEYNAVYAHVGGSPVGLERIQQLNIRDLNEFYFGKYYARAADRERPHNVFMTMDNLRQAITDRKFDVAPDFVPWPWKEDDPAVIDPASTTPPFFPDGWEYNHERNAYRRPYGSGIYREADGNEVWAKNVIVMHTDIAVIDDVLRKRIRTIGEGSAEIYLDGRKVVGAWKKRSSAGRLRFYSSDDHEVQFNAGLTWIMVTPSFSPLE